ncbi:MAG: phosphocarrier protein HPr [Robiginitomaculum sp.]|nr:MAG: phosphocarrier protein HPr [Robiginitomaculum sp.]
MNKSDSDNSVCQSQVIIVNDKGLHARAAAKFVSLAAEYTSEVYVCCNGERVNADSIMELLMLACEKGKAVTIEATGPDAGDALGALIELIDDGFGENQSSQ